MKVVSFYRFLDIEVANPFLVERQGILLLRLLFRCGNARHANEHGCDQQTDHKTKPNPPPVSPEPSELQMKHFVPPFAELRLPAAKIITYENSCQFNRLWLISIIIVCLRFP